MSWDLREEPLVEPVLGVPGEQSRVCEVVYYEQGESVHLERRAERCWVSSTPREWQPTRGGHKELHRPGGDGEVHGRKRTDACASGQAYDHDIKAEDGVSSTHDQHHL